MLHGQNVREALQGRLGQLRVVERHVAKRRPVQILGAVEAVYLEHVGNATVEATIPFVHGVLGLATWPFRTSKSRLIAHRHLH